MKIVVLLVMSLSVLACAQPRQGQHIWEKHADAWNGEVYRWGVMREVMHEGKTEGRVAISTINEKMHAYGVGALADLEGEILVDNGDVWISRAVGQDKQETRRLAGEDPQATLLFVAYVPIWRSAVVDSDVAAGELENYLLEHMRVAHHDPKVPTPLTIEGKFSSIEGHIVNVACPASSEAQAQSTPQFSASFNEIEGKVIGFYAENHEGVLTHHGSKVHLHLLSASKPPVLVHVDKLALRAGAILKVPARNVSRYPLVRNRGLKPNP